MLEHLKSLIQKFKKAIDEISILNPLGGVELPGEYIFTLMEKCDVIVLVDFSVERSFHFLVFLPPDCLS